MPFPFSSGCLNTLDRGSITPNSTSVIISHLKILDLTIPAQSHLPSEIAYSQVPGIRTRTFLGATVVPSTAGESGAGWGPGGRRRHGSEGAARCLSAGGEDWEGAWWAGEASGVHGGGPMNQWCRLGVGHLLSAFWGKHLYSLLGL